MLQTNSKSTCDINIEIQELHVSIRVNHKLMEWGFYNCRSIPTICKSILFDNPLQGTHPILYHLNNIESQIKWAKILGKINIPAANMMMLNTTPPENACSKSFFVPSSVSSCTCTTEGLHTALTRRAEQNIARVPTRAVRTTSSLRSEGTKSHTHTHLQELTEHQPLLLHTQKIYLICRWFLFCWIGNV